MARDVIGEFEDEAVDAIEQLVARVSHLEATVKALKKVMSDELGDDFEDTDLFDAGEPF